MKADGVMLDLSGREQRLMVNSLVGFRNGLLGADKPTEDVDDLIPDSPVDFIFKTGQ